MVLNLVSSKFLLDQSFFHLFLFFFLCSLVEVKLVVVVVMMMVVELFHFEKPLVDS
jgi:hypothetical protein